MDSNYWHNQVPNHGEFLEERRFLIDKMVEDHELRGLSLGLSSVARKYCFGYHSEWLGVPIIRHPEDLVRQQELIFRERPEVIVEVGIARGGGLLFSASMMEIAGLNPRVCGIDNKIYSHASEAVSNSRYSQQITMVQCDSISAEAESFFLSQISGASKVLLILDSDHSSDHVLAELQTFYKHLPDGSMVIVCDTIIDDLPVGTFHDRPWADGKGPRDAIRRFSELDPSAFVETRLTDDLLLTEMRDGILRKLS